MTVFFLIGVLFTLLAVAGGGVAWWWTGRNPQSGGGKRRYREEARHLQTRFEEDEDFGRNFHRPTQNELLETLQALDHLTPDWQGGDEAASDHRFKNELAESFPTLRKERCRYPEPIAEDLSRLFGKEKLSPEAMDERQRSQTLKTVQARAAFHAARAQANARHQIASGPATGPVEATPGSLPFRLQDASSRRSGRSLAARLAMAAAALLGFAALGWYLVSNNPDLRKQFARMLPGSQGVAPNRRIPDETAKPIMIPTAAPSEFPANAAGNVAPPANPVAAADTGGSAAPVEAAASPETVATQPPAPALAPAAVPGPTAAPRPPVVSALAQQVVDSKLRAIEKYPDLAVPNSEINSRFIFRYKKLVEEKSARLQDPTWPEKLAEECAAAAATGAKGKKITQASATRG